jgi:glycosyltransferase involved in cell wall biosynthesis
MKVLILTQEMEEGGGSEKVVSNLTRALGGEMEFVVVCSKLGNETRAEYPLAARRLDVDLRRTDPVIPILGTAARMRWRLELLKEILDRENPDLIVSNFTYVWHLLVLTAKALRLTTKPVIVRFGNPVGQETHARGRVYRVFLKTLLRWADGIVVNSSGVGRDLEKTLGISSERIEVINNPIPLAEIRALAAEPLDAPAFFDGVPVVVSAGRLATQKNYPLLLRAFRIVRGQMAARLVLVGTGHADGLVRATTDALGLRDDVVFAGFQRNPFNFMRRATLFALSSDYEGFGNVLVEAMASGCPIVSTDCHGPTEILRGGEDGLLVPVGDESALAAGMLRLLRDPALRETYSRRGEERAQAFDAPLIAGAYARVFREVAG